MKNKKKKGFEEWEISDALRSLERAEEVRQNPELMKQVEKLAQDKVKALKKIKWVK